MAYTYYQLSLTFFHDDKGCLALEPFHREIEKEHPQHDFMIIEKSAVILNYFLLDERERMNKEFQAYLILQQENPEEALFLLIREFYKSFEAE